MVDGICLPNSRDVSFAGYGMVESCEMIRSRWFDELIEGKLYGT